MFVEVLAPLRLIWGNGCTHKSLHNAFYVHYHLVSISDLVPLQAALTLTANHFQLLQSFDYSLWFHLTGLSGDQLAANCPLQSSAVFSKTPSLTTRLGVEGLWPDREVAEQRFPPPPPCVPQRSLIFPVISLYARRISKLSLVARSVPPRYVRFAENYRNGVSGAAYWQFLSVAGSYIALGG